MTSLYSPSAACVLLVLFVTSPAPGSSDQVNPQGLEYGPENVAVYAGDTVVLRCVTDGVVGANIRWYEYATTSSGSMISDGNVTLSGHPNYARYSLIIPDSRTISLQISNTVVEDAGYYQCVDSNAAPPSITNLGAQLVIIEALPNCTSTIPSDGYVIEGQYYSAECTVRFRASANSGIAPLLSWTGPSPYNSAYTAGNVSAWGGVGFTVSRTMDGQNFQCKHNFTTTGFVAPDSAGNAPTWTYTFPFNQMFVYWAPTNMTAYPLLASYDIGATITCWADAYPPPSYQWQSLRTSEFWYTQSFTTREDMVGYQLMRCTARNSMQGFDYTRDFFLDVYVSAPTTTAEPTTTASTTPVPAVSDCPDLTGRWEAVNPNSSLCLVVDHENDAQLIGLLRNGSDTFWLQISGRTREEKYDESGWSVIWPSTSIGVTSYAAECHRCYGVEYLLANGISRTTKDSVFCASGNDVNKTPTYNYTRVPTSWPCSSSATQMLKNVQQAGLLLNPSV